MGRKVVVVGGGFAGGHLALELEKNPSLDVTLVDNKEYNEIVFAVPRAITQGRKFGRNIVWKHSDYLKRTKIIASECTGVDLKERSISLADGEKLEYDFLVVCTGVGYGTFKGAVQAHTVEERLEQYDKEAEKVRNASCVIVVGGGPAGFELVGELTAAYPDKKITLITDKDRLLATFKPSTSETALKLVKETPNVRVIFNDALEQSQVEEGKRAFKTRKGEDVEGDVVYFAFGSGPNTQFIPSELQDGNRRVKVNQDLRVVGYDNVFAAGDISDWKEEKLAYRAERHAAVIAGNIGALAANPKAKTKAYSPLRPLMMASYGDKKGLGEVPFFGTITRFGPPMKAKDLFVGKIRDGYGLPAPNYS